MERVVTYNLGDNFIGNLADFILKNFGNSQHDLSRVACVFGGRRPALFLQRALAERLKNSFIPCRFLSIDEFIDYVISQFGSFSNTSDLDASYLIYTLVKKNIPALLKGRESFSQFLNWAKEIVSFIEQLDLEDIKSDSLYNIERSASIGYDIPENVNQMLTHIVSLREAYHSHLRSGKIYSRGMRYLEAAHKVEEILWEEFDAVVFCNFFYLHNTEQRIIKSVLDKGKGFCIFQGSQDDWSVLEHVAKRLNIAIRPDVKESPRHDFSLYQGFDIHSQACLVNKILAEKVNDKEDTVIVLPRPETMVPLLTEISSQLDAYNVSMGYSLKRSSLYALFLSLFKVQESRKNGTYYTKDYLNLLRHPLVKNLKIGNDPVITRVLVHKLEDFLQGKEESSIAGSLFLSLRDIESEPALYVRTSQTLRSMDITVANDECKNILLQLHEIFFRQWENINNFSIFASCLEELIQVLIGKSMLSFFPFNIKVIEKLQDLTEQLSSLSFKQEQFKPSEIWEIFQQKLESEMISFVGSPLRGTQILGLFETRSLNFKNVIIMDANESILPKLKIYEPLIPREVMLILGLNRLEKEEEIQRYQFMRLISCAEGVHLVYEENQEKEKSRFIEELLWQKQQEEHKIDVVTIPKAYFSMRVFSKESCVKKNAAILSFLKKQTYSASRVNRYLTCPLAFYFEYVLGLEEREDLLDEPEAQHIGTFIHELLEETFGKFKGRRPKIDHNFKKYFIEAMKAKFKRDLERRMKSDSFLLERIIRDRLLRFLDAESERPVAKLICLEEQRSGALEVNSQPVEFIYMVDRIDELEDKNIVIIDYKTGGIDLVPKRLSSLEGLEMTRDSIKENIKSFQLPIYYYFIAREFPKSRVNAALLSVRTLDWKFFISEEDYPQRERLVGICLDSLKFILSEIFNPDKPFEPDRDERKCKHCSFIQLCR